MSTPSGETAKGTAKSGSLSPYERSHLTAEALPLLAGYFATGVDSLQAQNAIGTVDRDDLDELSALVRLRVLLSAAEQIEPLVRAASARPSFQFRRESTISTGMIRGRLNTIEYLRRRHEITAPRQFPTYQVNRRHDLPENVLCVAAVLLVIENLRHLPLDRIPKDSIERKRINNAVGQLRRVISIPVFQKLHNEAARIIGKRQTSQVAETVRRRIETGRVPTAKAYTAIADWVDDFDVSRAATVDGDMSWLFYDGRFDTRLFEIWALKHLVDSLERSFGPPSQTRLLLERQLGPVATWKIADGGSIEVWFQAGLARLNVGGPTWNKTTADDPEGPTEDFTGIPDISVVIDDGEQRTPVLIDPKLRQREAVPQAEVYKLLGYFQNLPSGKASRGAIVFHAPADSRTYDLRQGEEDHVLAVGVNPTNQSDSTERFDRITELITATIPAPTAPVPA